MAGYFSSILQAYSVFVLKHAHCCHSQCTADKHILKGRKISQNQPACVRLGLYQISTTNLLENVIGWELLII